jgi:hypothetical protein
VCRHHLEASRPAVGGFELGGEGEGGQNVLMM